MARTKAFDTEAVLDRAVNIFWTKGYHATSLEDLVSGLEISRSSLYDTYSDKHTLYLATLKRYQFQTLEKIVSMLARAFPIVPSIEAILNIVISESSRSPKSRKSDSCTKGCFIVNSMIEFGENDAGVAAIIHDNNERFISALESALERGQKAGEITQASSSRSLAEFIFIAIIGMRVLAKSHPTKEQLEGIAAITLSCLSKK
jgi:TetR/AcrR family transcriptional regulator, transcriptional repressor for nem operon